MRVQWFKTDLLVLLQAEIRSRKLEGATSDFFDTCVITLTHTGMCNENWECHKVKKGFKNIHHRSLDYYDVAECFLNLPHLRL